MMRLILFGVVNCSPHREETIAFPHADRFATITFDLSSLPQRKKARNLVVDFVEPPSCGSPVVLIGKNSRGQWVAQHQYGLYGGLFTHRTAAVRYALFENGHHPEAIITIGCVLELDMAVVPADVVQMLAVSSPDALQRTA